MSKARFRNVYGEAIKEKFEGVKPSDQTSDSCLMKGNSKYFGVSWKVGGGGCLAVLPTDKPGRLPPSFPMIKGHTGAIIDFEFYPFNENVVATASFDTTIKIWEIPQDFNTDLTEAKATLTGHTNKANLVQFNNTCDNILASTGFEGTVKIWNLEKQAAVHNVQGPSEPFYSLDWNSDGSLLITANKDKTSRIIDPRANKVAQEFKGVDGSKGQKTIWLGATGLVFNVGFNKDMRREYLIYDLKNLDKPIVTQALDQQASVLYPFFDADTNLLFLAGRGDCNIRTLELIDGKFNSCLEYQSNITTRGVGFFPKRCVDVNKNELAKAMKLSDTFVEFISFRQPTKGETFREEYFPDCIAEIPAMTGEQWLGGQTSLPKRKSLKPELGSPSKVFSPTPLTIQKKDSVPESSIKESEVDAMRKELAELKSIVKGLEDKLQEKDNEIAELKAKASS
jgi:hypothetical protein